MKKITALFVFGLMAVMFKQCAPEDIGGQQLQTIQFVLVPSDPDARASMLADIDAGAYAIVTVKNSDGADSFERRLSLQPSEDGYITEPIRLPERGCVVSRFEIIDQDADALFSTSDVTVARAMSGASNSAIQQIVHLQRCPNVHAGKGRLKKFVYRDRQYQFHYNVRGALDSIVGIDAYNHYAYRVTYTRGRIDSVVTHDRGQRVSVNRDFRFNHRGQITGFNYFLLQPSRSPAIPVHISYDRKGRAISLDAVSLRYDRFDNVVWFRWGGPDQEAFTYTYDGGKNPFGPIGNLEVIMVEERWIWQFMFSRNNTVTRTGSQGNNFTFTNVYDARHRLVSNGEMVFDYY